MATGPITQVSDVVVPSIFSPYVQQETQEKARIIQSGAMVVNPLIQGLLAGGGTTFNVPSFKDLDNDSENVASDEAADSINASYQSGTPTDANRKDSKPKKLGTSQEIAVRLTRNNSWSSSDLTALLAGADPMQSIASRVAYYWSRRLQAAAIATLSGVFKNNTADDSGDYTNDISGSSFVDGVTNFSAEAFLDAMVTMGDSESELSLVLVHSIVYNRMRKNNLIDFIPDSQGVVNIPTFLGKQLIVDDGMPKTGSVYDTWLLGAGALQFGSYDLPNSSEVAREPQAGNGAGQEVLYSRVCWSIHPAGHSYVGSTPNGGPGNGTASNQLNNSSSWNRVFPERKQVKIARLITREA